MKIVIRKENTKAALPDIDKMVSQCTRGNGLHLCVEQMHFDRIERYLEKRLGLFCFRYFRKGVEITPYSEHY